MVSASITQPCFHEKPGRNLKMINMSDRIKYGRDQYVGGKWHPVETWDEMPSEEFLKAREEYDSPKKRFEQAKKTYGELLEDPCKWFRVISDTGKAPSEEDYSGNLCCYTRCWMSNVYTTNSALPEEESLRVLEFLQYAVCSSDFKKAINLAGRFMCGARLYALSLLCNNK